MADRAGATLALKQQKEVVVKNKHIKALKIKFQLAVTGGLKQVKSFHEADSAEEFRKDPPHPQNVSHWDRWGLEGKMVFVNHFL